MGIVLMFRSGTFVTMLTNVDLRSFCCLLCINPIQNGGGGKNAFAHILGLIAQQPT